MDKFQVVISPADMLVYQEYPLNIVCNGYDFYFEKDQDILSDIKSFLDNDDMLHCGLYINTFMKYCCFNHGAYAVNDILNYYLKILSNFLKEPPVGKLIYFSRLIEDIYLRMLSGIEVVKVDRDDMSVVDVDVSTSSYEELKIAKFYSIDDSEKWNEVEKCKKHDYVYLSYIGYLTYRGLQNKELKIGELRNKIMEFTAVKASFSKDTVKKKGNFNPYQRDNKNLKNQIKNDFERLFNLKFTSDLKPIESISEECCQYIFRILFSDWRLGYEQFKSLLNVDINELELDDEISLLFSFYP